MNFHNDPSDTIEEFLPSWDTMNSDFDDVAFVNNVEQIHRAEYAALADL